MKILTLFLKKTDDYDDYLANCQHLKKNSTDFRGPQKKLSVFILSCIFQRQNLEAVCYFNKGILLLNLSILYLFILKPRVLRV